ncbi:ferritin-like domain-containing protein [Sphingomonas sp. NCPPB 2930]
MIQEPAMMDVLQRRSEKLAERRQFFRKTGGFAAGMAGGAILTACGGGSGGAVAADAPSDVEILNFALNLEYLEAQFYQNAVFGTGLAASQQTGVGVQGAVVGGGRAVPFSDPVVAAYAREIARDEAQHVAFLRSALGSAAVAQPALDISGTDPNGAFSTAAVAAGLITKGQVFDPYANDANFLLAAFIFEDVGVTAYKGAAPLITNKTYLEAAAGILAAEAYHAGLVRTVLYSKGLQTPALRTSADAIARARDTLDSSKTAEASLTGTGGTAPIAGIVPLDSNGIAYSRSYDDVLNIVYLNPGAVTKGGFYPNGLNGTLVMSSAFA